MSRSTPLKRTGFKRKSRKRSPIVVENRRCDFWTPHLNRNPSRCTKVGVVIIDENTRYCKTHATIVADNLVGDAVKQRDGFECQLVGFNDKPCQGVLSACHLIPKGRYGATRFTVDNIVAGCASHHLAFDTSIIEKEAWIYAFLGDRYDELKQEAVAGAKYRPELVIRQFRSGAA